MNEIFRFFILPIFHPLEGIYLLMRNKRKIYYSVMIFLFLGLIYTFSVQLAYMKGIGPSVEPFIKIPRNEYYYWQRFYQIPFFFITSILFAGTARLISIFFSGKGNYEDHFCLYAVAQTFPMFITMWIPESIYFIFFEESTVMPLLFDLVRQIIGIIWPLIIMIKGIVIIEKIKWYQAIVVTIAAAVPTVLLMVIFIR